MNEEARRQLAELRSIAGWEAAYKAAGLPKRKPGDKDNTLQKRLSRVINRRTGGYKPLDTKQAKKVTKVYNQKGTRKVLAKGRADRAIKTIDKIKSNNIKAARKSFRKGGEFESKRQLDLAIRKNKALTKEQKQRIKNTFDDAAETQDFKKFRAGYLSILKSVDTSIMGVQDKKNFEFKLKRANDAVIRDGGNPSEL